MRPHNADDYTGQLARLMPRGLAWNRSPDGLETHLLSGVAQEPARIEDRAIRLSLYEFFAQSTRELLEEWEYEYGLPDHCRTLGETLDQRIEDLLQKIRTVGGQSKEYFISLAKALGIAITIDEPRPFRVGRNRVGERLYSREWLHIFIVNGPEIRIYRFRAGRNAAGDRLRYWRGIEVLECIINRYKPAHTRAIFTYQEGA